MLCTQCTPKELDPLSALEMNLRPWRELVWGRAKAMWSTASILHAAGRDAGVADAYRFVPARVDVGDDALIKRLEVGTAASNIRLFERSNVAAYQSTMNVCLRELFARFPSQVRTPRPR